MNIPFSTSLSAMVLAEGVFVWGYNYTSELD
jgi:hypothetical protein